MRADLNIRTQIHKHKQQLCVYSNKIQNVHLPWTNAKMLINALCCWNQTSNILKTRYILYIISHISVIRVCTRESISAMIKPSPSAIPALSPCLESCPVSRAPVCRVAMTPRFPGSRQANISDWWISISLVNAAYAIIRAHFAIQSAARGNKIQPSTVNCQLQIKR